MDVARKAREVLQRHMVRFLHQLEAQEFADVCTATQLAQAAGYAILVAAMGEQRSWCTDGQRHGWVTRSARALITDDRYNLRKALLSVVGRRYEDGGRSREFDQAIGDGQLWLTLLCAWSMLPDASAEERLQQVTLWRELCGSAGTPWGNGTEPARWIVPCVFRRRKSSRGHDPVQSAWGAGSAISRVRLRDRMKISRRLRLRRG